MIADTPNALITYRGEIPPEIQTALEPLIAKYKCLLPAWVHHLNIQYGGTAPEDAQSAVARTTVDCQYRTAYFDIYPCFLFTNEDKRWEFIQHEMVHVTWNPLYNYAQEAIRKLFELDALKDNKALKDLILEELKSRNESSTTDTQKIIADLMTNKSIALRRYDMFASIPFVGAEPAVDPLVGKIPTEESMKKDSKKEEAKESKKFEKAEEKPMKKPAPPKKKGY